MDDCYLADTNANFESPRVYAPRLDKTPLRKRQFFSAHSHNFNLILFNNLNLI